MCVIKLLGIFIKNLILHNIFYFMRQKSMNMARSSSSNSKYMAWFFFVLLLAYHSHSGRRPHTSSLNIHQCVWLIMLWDVPIMNSCCRTIFHSYSMRHLNLNMSMTSSSMHIFSCKLRHTIVSECLKHHP